MIFHHPLGEEHPQEPITPRQRRGCRGADPLVDGLAVLDHDFFRAGLEQGGLDNVSCGHDHDDVREEEVEYQHHLGYVNEESTFK